MSIILKGIDPKTDYGLCILTIRGELITANGKHIQAIQIPKDHGRLIDADKLRRGFSRTESGYCGYWEFCDKPEDVQFLIDDEPTILEAEENE